MIPAGMFPAGTIALDPYQMAYGMEANLFPRLNEKLGFHPAIETHAIAVRLQHPKDFGESRFHPMSVVVVRIRGSAIRGFQVDQVGWIGDHQVDACTWHGSHYFNAIAVNDVI